MPNRAEGRPAAEIPRSLADVDEYLAPLRLKDDCQINYQTRDQHVQQPQHDTEIQTEGDSAYRRHQTSTPGDRHRGQFQIPIRLIRKKCKQQDVQVEKDVISRQRQPNEVAQRYTSRRPVARQTLLLPPAALPAPLPPVESRMAATTVAA